MSVHHPSPLVRRPGQAARRRRPLLTMAAIPVLLWSLAACGSDDGADPAPGSSGSNPAAGSLAEYQLKMSQCLRDNGVDAADPQEGGMGLTTTDNDATDAAITVCRKKLGSPPPMSAEETKESAQQAQEFIIKIAKCYRDNGVDVPDPGVGEELRIPADAPDTVRDECGGPANLTGVPAQ